MSAKDRLSRQATVPIDIFVGNGARLMDKAAVEDYHANSIVSHEHRMSFKMRRPVRLYAMVRDGLAPVKARSKHIFRRTDLPPSYDLETVLQLESLWDASFTGVFKDEDLDKKVNVWTRFGAVFAAIAIVMAILYHKLTGGDDDSIQVIVNSLPLWMGY